MSDKSKPENAKVAPSEITWADVVAAKPGTIYIDRFEEGLRLIVLRGPCSLCAYIGIPVDHPLAGFSYDDLNVSAHGGLTFAGLGKDIGLMPDCWWYGWDYAHCDDFSTCDEGRSGCGKPESRKWLPAEVDSDSWEPLYDFKKLMKLAEEVAVKAKGRGGAGVRLS